jgi:probable phosphoglycerate mutase
MGVEQRMRTLRGYRGVFGALLAARRWYAARLRLLPRDCWQLVRRESFARRIMEQTSSIASDMTAQAMIAAQYGHEAQQRPLRVLRILLVRHGQTTYNVEGRLPGQLPGVTLTDEGRRQAHRAAVALAGLRLVAIISSPLERARDTADIIARGWGLEPRNDPRLMDTDVGPWAGRKISEVAKEDPNWNAYLKDPDNPPPGVESLSAVQARTVSVIEELRADETLSGDVVLVAHADVIKLALARYTGTPVRSALAIAIGNASISALAFAGEHPPTLLAANWTMTPDWLVAPAPPVPAHMAEVTTDKTQREGNEPALTEPGAEKATKQAESAGQ